MPDGRHQSGTYTYPVELAAGSHSIEFAVSATPLANPGSPIPTLTAYVDNVQVSIPEPSTFLLAGFFPLAFALQRVTVKRLFLLQLRLHKSGR